MGNVACAAREIGLVVAPPAGISVEQAANAKTIMDEVIVPKFQSLLAGEATAQEVFDAINEAPLSCSAQTASSPGFCKPSAPPKGRGSPNGRFFCPAQLRGWGCINAFAVFSGGKGYEQIQWTGGSLPPFPSEGRRLVGLCVHILAMLVVLHVHALPGVQRRPNELSEI